MSFLIDERIHQTCFTLGEWPLSRVLLKNNADYPWLILIPRIDNVQEIEQLPQASRYALIDEISALSAIANAYFKPDKLNVGALGNIVSQLHIHIIARFNDDKLWPHGIWQAAQTTTEYCVSQLNPMLADLRQHVNRYLYSGNGS